MRPPTKRMDTETGTATPGDRSECECDTHLHIGSKHAVRGVVFEEVGGLLGSTGVVDADDFKKGVGTASVHAAEELTANATKAIDGDLELFLPGGGLLIGVASCLQASTLVRTSAPKKTTAASHTTGRERNHENLTNLFLQVVPLQLHCSGSRVGQRCKTCCGPCYYARQAGSVTSCTSSIPSNMYKRKPATTSKSCAAFELQNDYTLVVGCDRAHPGQKTQKG